MPRGTLQNCSPECGMLGRDEYIDPHTNLTAFSSLLDAIARISVVELKVRQVQAVLRLKIDFSGFGLREVVIWVSLL